MKKTIRMALLAGAALACPAIAAAQTTTPAPATPAPAPAAPANEDAELQGKIQSLQMRALQDPSLKAATDSFNAVVSGAMGRLDPQAPAKLARAQAINGEVEAARAANDNARLNALAAEATGLQQYFAQLRPRAMADTTVQTARQAYLERVFAKMKELDPNVQQYVDRLTALRNGGGSH